MLVSMNASPPAGGDCAEAPRTATSTTNRRATRRGPMPSIVAVVAPERNRGPASAVEELGGERDADAGFEPGLELALLQFPARDEPGLRVERDALGDIEVDVQRRDPAFQDHALVGRVDAELGI